MRPGLVFVGLFVLLAAVYVGLADLLGSVITFVVQASMVIIILAASIWWRARKGT